nr:NotI family restriction endonuclease [Nocardia sp. CC201C]
MSRRSSLRGTVFPIVEAYGFRYDSNSTKAADAWARHYCPFSDRQCEKDIQYHYGYCSVTYSAKWDAGAQQTYAVCDHRLDGDPVQWAVSDYFGDEKANLVSEVTIPGKHKRNIDYMAYVDDMHAESGARIIAIETQAIDLRGGGVGPAWRAWENNDVANWRNYFTVEAAAKKRDDKVDYGVNTGNIYKRLGTQVQDKGKILKTINVPLYVVMQHSILKQLRARVPFEPVGDSSWDITFVGFEYPSVADTDGQLPLQLAEVVRTSLPNYMEGMAFAEGDVARIDLIERARAKAASSAQGELFASTE